VELKFSTALVASATGGVSSTVQGRRPLTMPGRAGMVSWTALTNLLPNRSLPRLQYILESLRLDVFHGLELPRNSLAVVFAYSGMSPYENLHAQVVT